MSQYSRAEVIARVAAANVKAAEALKSTAELKAWAVAHHKVMESRLAATVALVRREYDPAVRLARAGLAARLRWAFTGRLPASLGQLELDVCAGFRSAADIVREQGEVF